MSIHGALILLIDSLYLVWTGHSYHSYTASSLRAVRHSPSRPGRPEQGRVPGGSNLSPLRGAGRYRVHLLGYLSGGAELCSHSDYPGRGRGAGQGGCLWGVCVREAGHRQ